MFANTHDPVGVVGDFDDHGLMVVARDHREYLVSNEAITKSEKDRVFINPDRIGKGTLEGIGARSRAAEPGRLLH